MFDVEHNPLLVSVVSDEGVDGVAVGDPANQPRVWRQRDHRVTLNAGGGEMEREREGKRERESTYTPCNASFKRHVSTTAIKSRVNRNKQFAYVCISECIVKYMYTVIKKKGLVQEGNKSIFLHFDFLPLTCSLTPS